MFFDRVDAKYEAKQIIRTGSPSPVLVTALYLLLTSGIGYLVDIFVADPFSQAVGYVLEGYDPFDVYAYVFGGRGAVIAIFVSVLLSLYNTVMSFGYDSYILRTSRGEESGYRDLLDGTGLIVKVVVLELLVSLVTLIGGVFFIIPGILLSFSYAMATFCLLDEPEISVLEAMRRSRRLMRGRRMDLFVVELSFLGWMLLAAGAALVLGAVLGEGAEVLAENVFHFWLTPYMSIVFAKFYNGLIGWRAREQYTGPKLEF